MDNSILRTIRRLLNLSSTDTTFDLQLLIAINSAIFTLSQLGIGVYGIEIVDDTQTWSDLFGNQINVQAAKTYIFLKVRLEFDPPQTSFVIDAIERQIKELESRMITQNEYDKTFYNIVMFANGSNIEFSDLSIINW